MEAWLHQQNLEMREVDGFSHGSREGSSFDTIIYCTVLHFWGLTEFWRQAQTLKNWLSIDQIISWCLYIYFWFSWIHLENSYFCSTIRTWKLWGFWMLDLSTLPEAPSSTTLGVPGARWAKLRDRNAAPSVCDLLEDGPCRIAGGGRRPVELALFGALLRQVWRKSGLRIGDLTFVGSSQMSVNSALCGFKRTYYFAFQRQMMLSEL